MSKIIMAIIGCCLLSFGATTDAAAGTARAGDDVPLVVAQASATEGRLRTAITELQNGSPNYQQMEPMLRIAVRQQLPAVVQRLQSLGSLQSLSYEGEQQGADVYEATFENGSTVWMIKIAPNGKIAVLYFQ